MAHKFPYLHNRNGTYYFRMAIPTRFKSQLNRREILISLRTKKISLAKQRCYAFFCNIRYIFNVLPLDESTHYGILNMDKKLKIKLSELSSNIIKRKDTLPMVNVDSTISVDRTITLQNIRGISQQVLANNLQALDRKMSCESNLDQRELDNRMQNCWTMRSVYEDELRERSNARTSEQADNIIADYGLNLKEGEPLYNALCQELLKNGIEYCNQWEKWLKGDYTTYHAPQNTSMQTIIANDGKLLSELMDEYIDNCGVSNSSKVSKEQTFKLYIASIGDKNAQITTKDNARTFDRTLKKLTVSRQN